MIPRIGKGGGSFKDAVAYYAHDKATGKGMAETSERVEWVVSANLPIDTERGSKSEQIEAMKKCATIMDWTAAHQKDIKLAAGGSGAGRPLTKPAYTYSLSWAPGEEVSKSEMLAAARSSLKALGLQDHQHMIVAHNDTHMAHCHVVLNRVHPNTGKASVQIGVGEDGKPIWRSNTSCDRLRLSRWAEKYERDRGQILVDQRVENNQLRRANKATFNKLRSKGDGQKIVKGENLTREERTIIKRYQTMTPDDIRAQRAAAQEAEREQLAKRHSGRQARMEAELTKSYGARCKALQDELRAVQARIGAKGWFRQAVRKLTGHHQADIRAVSQLKAGVENIEQRINERRAAIVAQIAREKRRMAVRHDNERARDERLIEAGRAKQTGREEGRQNAHKQARKGRRTREERRAQGRRRNRSGRRQATRGRGKDQDHGLGD